MPSVSKSQQRLMGLAYAIKTKKSSINDVDERYRDMVKKLVDGMSVKSLKKFAKTKHDGLPERVSDVKESKILKFNEYFLRNY